MKPTSNYHIEKKLELKELLKDSKITKEVLKHYDKNVINDFALDILEFYDSNLNYLLKAIDDINFGIKNLQSMRRNGVSDYMYKVNKVILIRLCGLNNILYTLKCFDAPLSELRYTLNDGKKEDCFSLTLRSELN